MIHRHLFRWDFPSEDVVRSFTGPMSLAARSSLRSNVFLILSARAGRRDSNRGWRPERIPLPPSRAFELEFVDRDQWAAHLDRIKRKSRLNEEPDGSSSIQCSKSGAFLIINSPIVGYIRKPKKNARVVRLKKRICGSPLSRRSTRIRHS